MKIASVSLPHKIACWGLILGDGMTKEDIKILKIFKCSELSPWCFVASQISRELYINDFDTQVPSGTGQLLIGKHVEW